ncbi:phage head-tail adaptor, putative, SPP1 family [Roseovarius lutimaris]|uniref:Phage head-tail adaptor, putative, SPP1 family n=1 Tax=Roseovarius lutimaris TaxID=1005928 RepID=A0A1I4Z8T1_9RHOB|nr:phage head closure protein [Roseovarius lutimaris]SFN46666.1 phage head-tail adaptor, putative, SPP1 family [Roseovarius lutimaris]
MVLNAGSLNRRIQLKRATTTQDGFGGTIYEWHDHGPPIFARRRDVSDAERLSAAAWDNKLVVRFVIRSTSFSRGLKRTDMIAHEGVPYGIDGIKEVPDNRGFLEITAITSEGLEVNSPFEV